MKRFVYRFRWGVLAVALAFGGAVYAKGEGTSAAPVAGMPELQTWELDNGLKVAYLPLHKAPLVTVQVWYHAGSKDEPRDRRGSAHMFEHIMFKGTERVRPEEHARHVNRLGGYVNAATGFDATTYINTLPKEYVDFACELEAARMRGLLFRKGMIDTEREVVKEEIRQQENNPIAVGFRKFLDAAFANHPYAWTPGGYIEDLDATTPEDLKKFYDAYYQPNNAMLVVVGDVTKEQVEKCATAHFGPIPRGAEPPRPADAATEPPQTEARRVDAEPAQVGIIVVGYKVPEAGHADMYALQILTQILATGESSRLHKRLVSDDKIAVAAITEWLPLEHPGIVLVGAVFLRPEDAGKVEAALLDEVGKLRAKEPTARELQKSKNQLVAGFVFGLESVQGLAEQIGSSWILTGDPTAFMSDVAKYEAVTTADVKRVASTYLTDERMTVLVVPPGGAK